MNISEALIYRGEAESYERQEALWLLEHILKMPALELKLKSTQVLTDLELQAYLDGLLRLDQGEPLAYVIGSQPFWTLDLKVTPDTLVPRPDTEILIETVLDLPLKNQSKMIDLGTGTGAIALALATERPLWMVYATDIYPPTLEVAKYNAKKHDLNEVQFLLSSWYQNIPAQKFDLIVSNPPYIDEADTHLKDLVIEPYRALASPNQGLGDLEIIIKYAPNWLKSNGWVVLEHGYNQANAVQQLFEQYGFIKIRTVQDYGKNDRVTLAQWQNNN